MQYQNSPEEGVEDTWHPAPVSGTTWASVMACVPEAREDGNRFASIVTWPPCKLGEVLWACEGGGLGSDLTEDRGSVPAQDFKLGSSVLMSTGPAWLDRSGAAVEGVGGVWEWGASGPVGLTGLCWRSPSLTLEQTCLPLAWASLSIGPLEVPQFWQGPSVQEPQAPCSLPAPVELRLRASGSLPEAPVSVLQEECRVSESATALSFTSIFSVCSESHSEEDVCLADKCLMMLHWSEITSLSHCLECTESKVKRKPTKSTPG